jgi:hypothetical protein
MVSEVDSVSQEDGLVDVSEKVKDVAESRDSMEAVRCRELGLSSLESAGSGGTKDDRVTKASSEAENSAEVPS